MQKPLKPSDTKEARLVRVRKHRRGRRRTGWIDGLTRIGRLGLMSRFLPFAQETGTKPDTFLHAIVAQRHLDLDDWFVATGESPEYLSQQEWLALQACRAEWWGRDTFRYPLLRPFEKLPWRKSDSDVGLRLRKQLLNEDSQAWADQAEYWKLCRETDRFQLRRDIRMRDGSERELPIADAAAPARKIKVTRRLELQYRTAIILEIGRDYNLYGELNTRGKYRWDTPVLHFGELNDEWKNVNRAIFKAPIPGRVIDAEAFRPTWCLRSHASVAIGARWIARKVLEAEDRRLRAWELKRIDRLPKVRAELAKLVPGYVPPPPKLVNFLGTPKPKRPVDPWQVEAERCGWVRPRTERVVPLPRQAWIETLYPDWVHEVERPPIKAGLPDIAALPKLTDIPWSELRKMSYTHPPIITAFERAHTARLRAHRLAHWRWRRSKSDRYRSNRWHGFLCEAI
jgi:hypothetical protein